MMNKEVTLKQTSDWLDAGGILKCLTDNFDVPWKTSIDGEDLDLDYYGNRSGNKVISTLVENLLDEDNTISSANLLKLARIIFNKYGDNWARVALAYEKEYDPIQNYNGDEEYTDTETLDSTNSSTTTYGKQTTNSGTQSNTKSGSDNTTFGFGTAGVDPYTESISHSSNGSDALSFNDRKTDLTKKGKITDTHDYTYNSAGDQYQETDELDFGTGNNKRKDEMLKTGTIERSTNYNDTDNYKKEDEISFTNRYTERAKIGGERTGHHGNDYQTKTDKWGSETTKERLNAFNGGMTDVSDSTTYLGGQNGSAGSGSPGSSMSGDGVHEKVTESGTNYDYHVYGNGSWDDTNHDFVAGSNPLREKDTEFGTETHTIKETGKRSETEHYNNYSEATSKSGKETHTIKKGGKYKDETEFSDDYKESTEQKGTETHTLSDSGSETHTFSGNKTQNETLNITDNRIDNLTETNSGSDNIAGSESYTKTNTHNFHREGNLGVTSTQQMLTQELEFRINYNMFDSVVFPDIDKVLTCGYFGVWHP